MKTRKPATYKSLRPAQVGQTAERHHQGRERDQVGDGHPLNSRDRRGEGLLEGGQDEPGNAGIQLSQERADADGANDEPGIGG